MRAYRIAYDGRPFFGFQRQPDAPTVEGALFDALRALDTLEGDHPPGYAAAGRTDRGVSAVAQTVAFEAPEWLVPRALNAELPESVWVWASADVEGGFHATHDAVARVYRYHLHAPDADPERARMACATLSGRQDFHNLTPDDDGTVRDLAVEATPDGDYLRLRFEAGGFARQLVRRAVSVVSAVASGEAGRERIDEVLGPEPLDGPAGVAPAPAYPLVLADVRYGVEFAVDDDAATDTRGAFESLSERHATRARVGRDIGDGVG